MPKNKNSWVNILCDSERLKEEYTGSINSRARFPVKQAPMTYLHDLYARDSNFRVFTALYEYSTNVLTAKIFTSLPGKYHIPIIINMVYKTATVLGDLSEDEELSIFKSMKDMYGETFAQNLRFYLNPYVLESYKIHALFTDGGLFNIGKFSGWPDNKTAFIRHSVAQMRLSKEAILNSDMPFVQFKGILCHVAMEKLIREEYPCLKEVPIEILQEVDFKGLRKYVDLKEGRFKDVVITDSIPQDLKLSMEESKILLSKIQMPALILESGLAVPALEFMLAVSSLVGETNDSVKQWRRNNEFSRI